MVDTGIFYCFTLKVNLAQSINFTEHMSGMIHYGSSIGFSGSMSCCLRSHSCRQWWEGYARKGWSKREVVWCDSWCCWKASCKGKWMMYSMCVCVCVIHLPWPLAFGDMQATTIRVHPWQPIVMWLITCGRILSLAFRPVIGSFFFLPQEGDPFWW